MLKYKNLLIILGMFILIGSLSLVNPYTAPHYTNVTLTFTSEYTAPHYTNVTLFFGVEEAPPVDSCTYTSGDWIIDCSDNCVISSPVSVGRNDIIISGTGSFKTTVDISNYNDLFIEGTDSNNLCEVYCVGGCFI